MNFVADESCAGPVIRALREAGHDVVAMAEIASGARQAVSVEVPAGGTATASFGVQASHAYRVSGTVLGLKAPFEPQSGASGAVMAAGMGKIILVGENGRATNDQDLGVDGRFDFPHVVAGTYRAHLILFRLSSGQAPAIKMQMIRTPIEVNGSDVHCLLYEIGHLHRRQHPLEAANRLEQAAA